MSNISLKVLLGYLIFLKLQRDKREYLSSHGSFKADKMFIEQLQISLSTETDVLGFKAYDYNITKQVLANPMLSVNDYSINEVQHRCYSLTENAEKMLDYLLSLYETDRESTMAKMLLLHEENVFTYTTSMARALSALGYVRHSGEPKGD
jgi:hypothetical protein